MTSAARVRRWWIVGAVLSVVLAVAVVSVVYVTTRKPSAQRQSPTPLGLPAQELLTSSMQRQPIPGWRTTAEELGLPPGGVVKAVRNFGDRGYLLGITGTRWWLVGIDVATGRRTFASVELGPAENASGIDCFVNGPTMVLCIRQDRELSAHASVVDTAEGALLYDGPTDLRISGTQGPVVEQVGDYAVATVKDEGAHGVGPRAELTWSVPGSGFLSQQKDWEHDTPPQPIAVQGGAAYSTTDVVFSVADGKELKPIAPQGAQFGRALVYPGGFGYEYTSGSGNPSERVTFFDDAGRELSTPDPAGALLDGSRDIPIVRTATADVVMTLDGRRLLELPKMDLMRISRLIGGRLFVASIDDDRKWEQYDLRTGEAGKTCDGRALGSYYIASDGEVAVALGELTPAQAIDLTTCEVSWAFPGSAKGESVDVWRVNTTLIQRTNDELFSLVAPR